MSTESIATSDETVVTRSELFSLSYGGPDIENGEMDVLALGPALTAMGELFQIANEVLNGNQTRAETKVKAEFREGSFEIFYTVTQFLQSPHAGIIPALYVLGSDKLVGQVIGKVVDRVKEKVADLATEGLFSLFSKLEGKKPESTTYDESKHNFTFVLGSNNNVTVDQGTGTLYKNPRVRSAAARVAGPLIRPGVNKLEAKRNRESVASLGKADVESLLLPEITVPTAIVKELGDGLRPQQMVVKILRPSLSDGRGKWSVSDGSRKFDVLIQDETFISRVHSREIGFYEGDLYRVEMLTTQKVNGTRLSTERVISRVIEAVPLETQSELPIPVAPPNRRRRSKSES